MNCNICEIFESIQGEGKTLGKPSIFIRTFGCNLRCRFDGKNCDTPYSVHNVEFNSTTMCACKLVEKIKKFNSKHIVWTGGEPTIYQEFIVSVMNFLDDSYTCEVETNATIPLKDDFKKIVNQFNMSVKLKSSNQESDSEKDRYNEKAIKTFPADKSYFKFVCVSEDDLMEIKDIAKRFPNYDVYLMPQGVTREEIIKNSSMVVSMCIKYKWIFSPREHIIIWNTKKGV